MYKVSYKIDWITATNKGIDMDIHEGIERLQVKLGEREWLIADRTPPPYTEGIESDAGIICWSPDYPEFGVMFRAGGANVRALRDSGIDDPSTVKALLGLGWGMRRLDIAVDIYDTAARPKEIYDLWKTGNITTPAREVTIFQKASSGGKISGETVYIGSRKSKGGRLLRVYDKGAELGVNEDIIRVEMELKDKYAQKAAQDLIETVDIKRVAANNLFSIVPRGLPEWITRAVVGPVEIVHVEADTQTNFEKWFTKIVLPAIEKAVGGEVPDAKHLVERAILSAEARKRGREMSMRRPKDD